jgi:hypothetical protein
MSSQNDRRARQRVAQMRAEQARRHRRRRELAIGGSVVGVLAVAALVGYGVVQGRPGSPAGGSGLSWPVPADPQPGIRQAGLDLGPMGQAEHYHAHLDVFADGKPVPVPANIGVDASSGAMSAVHTHDTRGVIHIEAHTKGERYTLGQVFTQWRVLLSANQVGPLKSGGGKTLTAYVNGAKQTGDPAAIVLAPHQQIALVYGSSSASFTPPASYRFQPGE